MLEGYSTVDEALGVDLPAFIRIDGVLVASEVAAVEALVGVLGTEGESLTPCCRLAESVGDVQIVELDIRSPQTDCRCCVVVGETRCLTRQIASNGDFVVLI